jgi:plasmid maintenance system antidote protein VapI
MDTQSTGGELGDVLREAFARSGLSRLALAKRARVPYASLWRLLAGERDVRLGVASRLAEALGLELVPVKRKRTRKDGDA